MTWPLPQDYNEAIQNPASSFNDPDLKHGQATTNALGIPMPHSGNFADVYELHCRNGSRWAVKCFTRQVPDLRERYREVIDHLRQAQLSFTVDCVFLDQGIRIHGQWFPILKMEWIEGLTLNEFLRQYADKPKMMDKLMRMWVRLSKCLREAGIAHGDLQHGNLLLEPHRTDYLHLKLIDYDGMWVPALANRPSGELGHPCYQHPQRWRERTYGPQVDRFSFLLIATALRALRVAGDSLWAKYNTGDNLLFREADLQAPVKSNLFYELLKIDDPLVCRLVHATLNVLKAPLASVPLLEEVLPELLGSKIKQTPVSRQEPAQAAKPAPEVRNHWWGEKTSPAAPPPPTIQSKAEAWWFAPPVRSSPPAGFTSTSAETVLDDEDDAPEPKKIYPLLIALFVSVAGAAIALGFLLRVRPALPPAQATPKEEIRIARVDAEKSAPIPSSTRSSSIEPPRAENKEQLTPPPKQTESSQQPAIAAEDGEQPTSGQKKVEPSSAKPAEVEPDKPIAVFGTLLKEMVPGYETRRYRGFKFLLSTQVVKESHKEKGKPIQALQAEFDGLVRVLPANALKHLRSILIWIEWDNLDRRNPNVLAKYYANRIWLLDGSAHPLKSNAVEVLSLKKLSQEQAAAREKSRLVLLHELAHAVHRLALGFNNVDVTFAYNQAMDRRLYDKVKDVFGREVRAYAATNAAEYFAELSCAYLDHCIFFPFTRADLREHDPTGYRLMQKVWGNSKASSENKSISKPKTPLERPTQSPTKE